MPNAKELNEKQLELMKELMQKVDCIISYGEFRCTIHNVQMEKDAGGDTYELDKIIGELIALEGLFNRVLDIKIFVGTGNYITVDSAKSEEEAVYYMKHSILRTLERALIVKETLRLIDTEKNVHSGFCYRLGDLIDVAEKILLDVF